MFAQRAVTDFKGEAVTRDDRDHLRLVVEIARGADRARVAAELAAAIKLKFEIAADIEVVEAGTIAQDFEKSVKAPRFTDRRNAR
jgi:phenylacetate-CoA ligase